MSLAVPRSPGFPLLRAARGPSRPAWLLEDRLVRCVAAGLAAYVAVYFTLGLVLAPNGPAATVLMEYVYLVPELAAVVLLAAASRVSRRCPWFWRFAALAMLGELLGDATWALYAEWLGEPPMPSPADAFYLAQAVFLVLAVGAAFALVRPRWRDLVDLAIPFGAVLFAVYEFVLEPQLTAGVDVATALSVSECVLTVLAALLFTAFLSASRDVPASVGLVYASVAVQAVCYPVYAYAVSVGLWNTTSWIYTGWQVSAALLILAALVRLRRGEPVARPVSEERDIRVWLITSGLLVVFGAVALRPDGMHLNGESPWVALLAIAVVLVRLHQTVHQRGRLAADLRAAVAEQTRLATTDPLTDVGNRRAFDEMLHRAAAEAASRDAELALLIVDIDHFKRVNDGYGHPAGDETLRQVVDRLRRGVRPADVLARIGGEEFALLLHASSAELALLAERCRALISGEPFMAEGQAIHLTASVGGASWPDDATSAEGLAQVADRALYEAKRRGRNRVHVGAAGVTVRSLPMPESSVLSFLQGLADQLDREQSEDEHSLAMLELSARLCDALRLAPARRRRCLTAARLHDIGKLGIPAAILTKQGPLSAHEWVVMREHVRIGVDLLERCAETRDIAQIVGDHHERPDGRGYPAGKSGDEISLEARIIAVADAWTAMLANRPYRPALTVEQARTQLVAGRGSQFDEVVVDALVRILDAEPDRLAQVNRAA